MLQGGRRACRAPQAALPGGTERPAASEATLGVCARAQATREELGRRRAFEDAIKRPYFHVKPLDGAQLAAWGRYLDYALPGRLRLLRGCAAPHCCVRGVGRGPPGQVFFPGGGRPERHTRQDLSACV